MTSKSELSQGRAGGQPGPGRVRGASLWPPGGTWPTLPSPSTVCPSPSPPGFGCPSLHCVTGALEDPVYLLNAVHVPSSFAAQSDLIVSMTLEIQVSFFALCSLHSAHCCPHKSHFYIHLSRWAGPSLPCAWDRAQFHEPLKKYLTNDDGMTELLFS